ncbi:linoleate diol synthase [Podospora conica]|nr:linoleate diol synthase [Schizothecium conicum]
MASYQNGEEGNGSKGPSTTVTPVDPGGERVSSLAKPMPKPLKGLSLKADRKGVKNAFEQYGQIIQSKAHPLPNQSLGSTKGMKWGKLTDDIKRLRVADLKTLKAVVVGKIKGEKIKDDKTMLMEQVIQLVSNLNSDSKLRASLTSTFLKELWESIDHPPLLYVGNKFEYRMADGSNNNPMFPQLGAAGSTYARSVNPTIIRPGALPDPELIYESVMKRTEFKSHPNNVSSFLWHWASIIIHDLFWTDYPDMTKSKTSSYLDLSPLYGSNQKMQDSIRTFEHGKLKADCFADKRILGMPPGVGVILIMFNRFHNQVCDNLIAINEDGRFTAPVASERLQGEKLDAAKKTFDNDLFQTARLITSGLYINITLVDYVRNIVNLNRMDTSWTLDPRQDSKAYGLDGGADRGTGNVVSVEFNLCYRWHSALSEKDDRWIEEFYHELFGKPANEVSVEELVRGFGKFEQRIPDDPAQRPFNKFKRGHDGKFNDDDLVDCISDVIEDVAGSFGARNVPSSMKAIEILGIVQGRKWNVCGLNEFRKHFALKPYESFEDINSDPGVADALRRMYGHPDFVELYPGLVAEEPKQPMVPGVGISPTYTISRVVLSDAVVLVRGDRHHTQSYSPRYLTNWGFNEVQYDMNVNHGCVFYKLLLRAFPQHMSQNSVYAHYPMVVPSETLKILRDLKQDHLFDWSRPTRQRQAREVATSADVKDFLGKPDQFRSKWHSSLQTLLSSGGSKHTLSGDAVHHDNIRQQLHEKLYTAEVHAQVKEFYRKTTERLLDEASYPLGGRQFVDVVREVGNIVPVEFAARVLNLPLDSKDNKKGIYKPHELYAVLALLNVALWQSPEPVKAFPIYQAAYTVATQLATIVEGGLKGSGGYFAKKTQPISVFGAELVKGLAKGGKDAAWTQILPTAAALAPTQSTVFAQAVDYYLSPNKGHAHHAQIHAVACQPPSAETDALLLGYALEGARLSGAAGVHLESVAPTAAEKTADGPVPEPEKIYVSFTKTCKDAHCFPEPESVNPSRPLGSYVQYSAGPHAVLGTQLGQAALTEMFRAVMKRKGLARAKGPQGELKKIVGEGERVEYLREDWGAKTPFPVTMLVTWDI